MTPDQKPSEFVEKAMELSMAASVAAWEAAETGTYGPWKEQALVRDGRHAELRSHLEARERAMGALVEAARLVVKAADESGGIFPDDYRDEIDRCRAALASARAGEVSHG